MYEIYKNISTGEVGVVTGASYRPFGKKEFWFDVVNYDTGRHRVRWTQASDLVPASEEEWWAYLKKVNEHRYEIWKQRPPRKNAERDKYIYEQRQAGRTYKSIGDEFGLTSQRIKGICEVEARRGRSK